MVIWYGYYQGVVFSKVVCWVLGMVYFWWWYEVPMTNNVS